MIQDMRRLTSFKNLLKSGDCKGQIATLLIMLTVVLLIFVMVTMNIGETSLMSTRIANAADAATLSLASQLSTKARQLAEGLKNSDASDTSYTKACSNTGMAAIICAIVLVIIAIVILVCSWGSGAPASAKLIILAVSIVAGAAGGAAGGAYAGTGAWQGAMQGAIVGAAIATIYIGAGCPGMTESTTLTGAGEAAGFGSAGELGSLSGAGGGSAGAGSGGLTGFGEAAGYGSAGELGSLGGAGAAGAGAGGGTVASGATTMSTFGASMGWTSAPIIPAAGGGGAMFQGALTLASTGYNQSVQDKIAEKQIDLFVKMMENANERDRMRESAFMTALSQIVDDPNMSADQVDSNFNGNTKELVSDFQIWVFNRLNYLGSLVGDCITPINSFFDITRRFQHDFSVWCDGEDRWEEIESGTFYSHVPGHLETEEYRYATVCDEEETFWGETILVNCHEEIVNNAGNDGGIVNLLRGLENAGYDISFWEPGPTLAQLKAAAESCGEDSCVDPPGFDPVDGLREEVREAKSWLVELDNTDKEARAQTWGSWLDVFVDLNDSKSSPNSFYFTFQKYTALLQEWADEVLAIVRSLPECQPDPKEPGSVLVFPCKYVDPGFEDSCTVTKKQENASMNFYDGILSVYNDLCDSAGINKNIRDLYNALYTSPVGGSESIGDLGGLNPAMYQWDDARGHHIVKVGTGNFQVPKLVKRKYGNWFKGKKCMELRDYYDDTGSNCWVKVERTDPQQNMGFLGVWNPFRSGISKVSRAAYSYNYLKLVGGSE